MPAVLQRAPFCRADSGRPLMLPARRVIHPDLVDLVWRRVQLAASSQEELAVYRGHQTQSLASLRFEIVAAVITVLRHVITAPCL